MIATRRVFCLLLALLLTLALWAPSAYAAQPGLDNFVRQRTYTAGIFSDVAADHWSYDGIAACYEYGLMQGRGEVFDRPASLTVAEALTMADRIHEIYQTGASTLAPAAGSRWYTPYVDYALEQGFDCLVTGHYARVAYDETSGRWQLKKAVDTGKDQSYVLYMLTQKQLAHLRLPLGEKLKTETRQIAEEQGFINARKHDSQDICFVPDGDYAAFLERWSGKTYPEGDILDPDGHVLGRHRGAVRYTIGQRKGLNLAMGRPVYVCGKDMEKNTVTVGPEEALFHRELLAGKMNWLSIPESSEPIRVTARTRYHQTEKAATAYPLPEGRLRLVFDEPLRAITAGQAVVLYDGDLVLGGGTILKTE